jgi:hypothetical protein
VRMRDADKENFRGGNEWADELEDSVIVDRASGEA